MEEIIKQIHKLKRLPRKARVEAYNQITKAAQTMLGFGQTHPCLAPQLIKKQRVVSNNYNPNKVAPPELALLNLSIERDGLTMPIVVNSAQNPTIIVDGHHRSQVCKTDKHISASLEGYIPCSVLDKTIDDRMAATVRHNMARGSHQTKLTSDLILILKKYSWPDRKISKELGMDPDEILRLKQILGIAEVFADEDFSRSWEL